jgi:hypothetical protein
MFGVDPYDKRGEKQVSNQHHYERATPVVSTRPSSLWSDSRHVNWKSDSSNR